MPKYNHAFDLAFQVISDDEQGEDVTAEMLYTALIARANQLLKDGEMVEATGCPFDTFEIKQG